MANHPNRSRGFQAVMKFDTHYGTHTGPRRKTRQDAIVDLESIARDHGAEIVRRFEGDTQSIAMHVLVPDETEGVGLVQRV